MKKSTIANITIFVGMVVAAAFERNKLAEVLGSILILKFICNLLDESVEKHEAKRKSNAKPKLLKKNLDNTYTVAKEVPICQDTQNGQQ